MVSVIIVNWNTGKLLEQCLDSLNALPEASLISRVYVVDNASFDDSFQRAQRSIRSKVDITYVAAQQNLGFARATNLGWEKVSESDDVLLLNPDTKVFPGALQAMVAACHSEARAAIVGPQLIGEKGIVQPSVRHFPSLLAFVWLFLKLHRVFPGTSWWQEYLEHDFDYTHAAAVDQVMGAAFLIRSEAWQELGKLDPQYYLWFEEVDYCRRAKDSGWHVRYEPRAQVLHYGSVSFHQVVGWARTWPFLHSSLRYARQHLGLLATLVLWVLVPVSVLIIMPSSFVHLWQRQRASLQR